MVDYETFLQWATDRFGPENIKIQKDEIKTHSIFAEDHKFHLWMNPTGGKSSRPELGSYRCWYTDRMGSLVSLVSIVDKIPYDEAEELICGSSSLRALEKKVDEFYRVKAEEPLPIQYLVNEGLELPPHTFGLDEISRYNKYGIRAIRYLESRKIPTNGLHVCIDGDYKNRVIIPYYDSEGRLVYYNARTLSTNPSVLRYMKPDNPVYKQEDVLFMPVWPRNGSKIYLTEGELDAISLNVAELIGGAFGGKSLSDLQMEMLRRRNYIPVLALDNDEEKKIDSGREALIKIGDKLLANGFGEVYYVRPPKGYKDWNKLLELKNKELVKAYIEKFEQPYNSWTAHTLNLKKL